MKNFLELIRMNGDSIIIISGVVLFIFLIVNSFKLVAQKERIHELLERRNRKYKKNIDTHELEEEEDEGAAVTPDTIRSFEKKFNDCCSWHSAMAQLISVFPLMGVFGTVTGLMLQAGAKEFDKMLDSLEYALTTTFWGLAFAILLKIFDAIGPAKTINDVEVMLDNFDKKLELANMYDDVKNK